MSNLNTFTQMSENEQVAFYGAVFAIVLADGLISPEEQSFINDTINANILSNFVQEKIKQYTTNPPSLANCLHDLKKAHENVRLEVAFALTMIIYTNVASQEREKEIIKQIKVELNISDKQEEEILKQIQIEKNISNENTVNSFSNIQDSTNTVNLFSKIQDWINSDTVRSNFSPEKFLNELKKRSLKAGKEIIKIALLLFFALEHPKCTPQDKLKIFGALAYFLMPIDIIPDFLLGGFTDDLGALTSVVITVASFVDDSVREKAKKKAIELFGE